MIYSSRVRTSSRPVTFSSVLVKSSSVLLGLLVRGFPAAEQQSIAEGVGGGMSVELGMSVQEVEERYLEVRGRYPKLPEKLRPFQVSVGMYSVGVGKLASYQISNQIKQLNIRSNHQIIKSSSWLYIVFVLAPQRSYIYDVKSPKNRNKGIY